MNPLSPEELEDLPPRWTVEAGRLVRTETFPDFASGLAWVVRIAAYADEVNHHPDVHLVWGRVQLQLWTHDVRGLTALDLAFARGCPEP